jgi:hypothetical protein
MELAEHIRRLVADPELGGGSYTDIFTGKKTDIATSPGGAVNASRVIINSDVHAVLGWSFAETTGTTPATIRLHDGNAATGEVFARINLAANESVRDWYIPKGVRCFTGRLFLEVIAGSVEGVVYWQ